MLKLALVVGLLSGCATVGVTDKDVIAKVAFDKSCPESDVKIVDKMSGEGMRERRLSRAG